MAFSGALFQLAIKGTEDIYVCGNPDITYFQYVYLRHTIFQRDQVVLNFYGDLDFGKKTTCTIGKNGDLLSNIWLECSLPRITATQTGANGNAYWIPYVGHALIKTVELEIAGTRIDKQYGEWMQVWYELTTPQQKRAAGNTMLGVFTSEAQNLFIPLQFWFCRYQNQPLPLAALQYSDVKINIEFAPLNELYITDGYTDDNLIVINNDQNQNIALKAHLLAEFIHLGNEERHRIASSSHEYLIEQLQYNGMTESSQPEASIFLKFINPIKEIFWFSKKHSQIQVISNYNFFNFTDTALEKKANIQTLTSKNFETPYYQHSFTYINTQTNQIETRTVLLNGNNPTKTASLVFDGKERITDRIGDYYNVLQQYEHHSNSSRKGINVYSFSQHPEQYQPTGTCNFSKLDNVRLNITYANLILNRNDIPNYTYINQMADYNDFTEDLVLTKVYALGYNVIRIISGLCSLVYPN